MNKTKIIGLLAKEIAQSIRNKPTSYDILEHEHDLKSANLMEQNILLVVFYAIYAMI